VTDTWFLCPEERPDSAVRLFCFPFAGGGASAYHSWARALPASVEVRSVQLPGHETRLREPLITCAQTLGGLIADALLPYLDRPFAFFGHSLGALLSFEAARELRRRGSPMPDRMFVSAKSAPQLPLARPPVFELPEADFLQELRRLFRPPEEAWGIPELLQLLLPVMRADMAVCDSYVFTREPPLPCPIQAFGGEDDPEAGFGRLDAWREQTTSTFSTHVFPGGHFYLFAVAAELQAVVGGELARLLEERGPRSAATRRS
jgi:surfactin synthase thioesterase subunit